MDITKITEKTYELADILKETKEYQQYLQYENFVLNDKDFNQLITDFNQKKTRFEEALKYGNYYPGMNEIKNQYQQAKIVLMKNESFKKYKGYEKEVDLYLYQIESRIKKLIKLVEKHDKSIIKFI